MQEFCPPFILFRVSGMFFPSPMTHFRTWWPMLKFLPSKKNCKIDRGPGCGAEDPHPSSWEGLVGRHLAPPRPSSSIQPELTHVQSTKREFADFPDLRARSQSCTANESSKNSSSKTCDNTDDTGSSLAECAHIETASSSDSDSSDTEEWGTPGETIKAHTVKTVIVLLGVPDSPSHPLGRPCPLSPSLRTPAW